SDLQAQDARPWSFGCSIAMCGDLDADGCSEFAIGAASMQPGGEEGRVFIYSGRTGALVRTLGPSAFGSIGWGLANVGDHDGDGLDDIAVSLENPDLGTGCVEIRSSRDGSCLRRFLGRRDEASFGDRIVAIGDVDLDGTGDLLVHALLHE